MVSVILGLYFSHQFGLNQLLISLVGGSGGADGVTRLKAALSCRDGAVPAQPSITPCSSGDGLRQNCINAEILMSTQTAPGVCAHFSSSTGERPPPLQEK